MYKKLIVQYLPLTYTTHQFKDLFRTCGEIKKCNLVLSKSSGTSLGYGFIEFCNIESAKRAMKNLNGKSVYDEQNERFNFLRVGIARKQPETSGINVEFSKLPVTMSTFELEDYISESTNQSIEIADVKLQFQNGESKGIGLVKFHSKKDAEVILSLFRNRVIVWENRNYFISCKIVNEISNVFSSFYYLQILKLIK